MCLNFLSILCFIVVLSFGYVYAQNCGESMFFRPNSTYDTNRRLILSTFPSKVSSQDGYYSGSVGEGSQRIYALGLCIPGTDPKVCSDCIETASVGLLQNCPNQTDSWDWRADKTLCFVRYSNPSFFDEIDQNPNTTVCSSGVITENVTEFKSIWDDFMKNMIAAASVSTPGMPARRHYAADISLPTPGFQRFYALMQCLPGISSVNCDACLKGNVRDYKGYCGKNIGGGVLTPVCLFRWDLYPYLGAFDKITPQPISTRIIVAIVVSSVLFVHLLL
ncbi:putative cysteine-rich receptor-like protein kinase 32 [Cardamine amara subsp. amara]|uniref:Cysteine-rich receptor-like protein kinase 32 n=1 Tax=Cardamine amara subsp. amara TaxID=228776 RepID=A0ABD1BF39_CARAN